MNLDSRITAREVISFACAARGEFEGQLRVIEANLEDLESAPWHDFLIGTTVHKLAIFSCQQNVFANIRRYKALADSAYLPEQYRRMRIQTYLCLSEAGRISGDLDLSRDCAAAAEKLVTTQNDKLNVAGAEALRSFLHEERDTAYSAVDRALAALSAGAASGQPDDAYALLVVVWDEARFNAARARKTMAAAFRHSIEGWIQCS